MPSHLSSIGFEVEDEEQFATLAQRLAADARPVPVPGGRYLRWASGRGEEMWLQVDRHERLVGMNPHYSGRASIRVALQARVARETDAPLDGAFHGWADPADDALDSGAYPFVFDSPDSATYQGLELPCIVPVQIAAFAHELQSFASVEAYAASQADQKVKFASQSFIPAGLFSSGGDSTEPPQALEILTGHVSESIERRNPITGKTFYWSLVETLGGRFVPAPVLPPAVTSPSDVA